MAFLAGFAGFGRLWQVLQVFALLLGSGSFLSGPQKSQFPQGNLGEIGELGVTEDLLYIGNFSKITKKNYTHQLNAQKTSKKRPKNVQKPTRIWSFPRKNLGVFTNPTLRKIQKAQKR